MSLNDLKYIHVRHWDYWYAVYSIGSCKMEDLVGLEFNITDDEEGEKQFFHVDLDNLSGLKSIIAEGEFVEKEEEDFFLQQYHALKNHKIDFFIAYLYYPEEEWHGNGYNFLSVRHCILNGNSIFDLKNKNGKTPYYCVIFINELEALSPKRVIQWMERLSKELFLKGFEIKFANIPSKEETLYSYEEDKSRLP